MKFFAIFVAALTYAMLRYIVFGNVPIENLPCFVANKAFALASVLALLLAAYFGFKKRSDFEREWFAFFKVTLFLHLALSFVLFSPQYYPKQFHDGRMTLFGELFMLFGVIALCNLSMRVLVKEQLSTLQFMAALTPLAIALHQFFLGASGWLKWHEWFGHMPPISLIGFVVAMVTFVLQIRRNTASGASPCVPD